MSHDPTKAKLRELVKVLGELPREELHEFVLAITDLGEGIAADPQPNREELRRVRTRIRRERRRARELLDDLLRVDLRVREEEARTDTRFHSLPLIDLLLKRAQAEVLNDPKITRRLAELALVIADAMYPSPTIPHATMRDYFALAHAQIGNVCRLHCEWEEAHARFDKAQGLLLKGAGDLAIHGQVHRMYGALLKDQREFPAALAFLHLARDDFREIGQNHDVGLVLLTTAVLYRNMGARERALQVHMDACQLLNEAKAPVMVAAAWKNLALYLCDLGQYEEAAAILDNLPTVFERIPLKSEIHINLLWVQGMAAQGLGDLSRAEELYLSVRAHYERLGDLYSCARVSLDLLRLHFQRGQLAEVERLAESVYSSLATQPLEPESQEALRLLVSARANRHLVEAALNRFANLLAKNPFPGKRSPGTEG